MLSSSNEAVTLKEDRGAAIAGGSSACSIESSKTRPAESGLSQRKVACEPGKKSSMASLVRKRVFIVDDHPIVRLGLAQVINRQPDLEVCGEAGDMAEAMRQIEATQPDIVVVDIALDGESGIELMEYIRERWPETKVLVSSAHDERVFAGRVLRAGAMGYISKREAIPKIAEALRQVLGGEVYLSPQMASSLLRRAATGRSLDQDPVETLSDREIQVFEMIGQGMTTSEIAGKLTVSPKTVESYRKFIKTKLNLTTSAQLAQRAFQWVHEGK
jgi:DNA-binding NarL/FixJ family response regulator